MPFHLVRSISMSDTISFGNTSQMARFHYTGYRRPIWLPISSQNHSPTSFFNVIVKALGFYLSNLQSSFLSPCCSISTCPAGGVLDYCPPLSGQLFILPYRCSFFFLLSLLIITLLNVTWYYRSLIYNFPSFLPPQLSSVTWHWGMFHVYDFLYYCTYKVT